MCDLDDLEDCCDCCDCCGKLTPCFTVAGCLCFIGCLLLVILLPLSLKKISFDEVAIRYDKVSRSLGKTPLEEGLHNVGPSGSLLKFKTTQREGRSSRLLALSQDSIVVTLDVIVFYSIAKKEVYQVLEAFGDQDAHDDFILNFAAAQVRGVAATFTAKRFYEERQFFQVSLQKAMEAAFASATVYATVDSVQVVNIALPPSVLKAMEDSTVARQDIENAKTERQTQVEKAQIDLRLAKREAELTIIEAEKDVEVINEEANQALLIEREKLKDRTDAFKNISTTLGKGGDFFVDSYLKYLVTQTNVGDTVVGV